MENTGIELAYNGHCAFAVSSGKTDVKGGKHHMTINDKTYVFSNGVAKLLFRILPNRMQKANENWKNRLV